MSVVQHQRLVKVRVRNHKLFEKKRRRLLAAVVIAAVSLVAAGAAFLTIVYPSLAAHGTPTQPPPIALSGELAGLFVQPYEHSDGNMRIDVKYPLTGDHSVNQVIGGWVQDRISVFRDYCASHAYDPARFFELGIGYQIARFDRDVFLSFALVENKSGSWENIEELHTFTYDLSTGVRLSLSDILIEDRLEALADRARAQFLGMPDQTALEALAAPDAANFSRFVLGHDTLRVYFLLPSDVVSVVLELDSLEGIVKPEWLPLKATPAPPPSAGPTPMPTPPPVSPTPATPLPGGQDDQKLIALTFDDGPENPYTMQILDLLDEYDAKATFFVLGMCVDRHPGILAQIAARGHAIGTHGDGNKNLSKIDAQQRRADIIDSIVKIERAAGVRPKLLRPPYGVWKSSYDDFGLGLAMWSVDPEDWKHRNAATVADHIIAKARDGDVVLMHDLYGATVGATRRVLEALGRQGFRFVTQEELIEIRAGRIEPGVVYSRMTPAPQ